MATNASRIMFIVVLVMVSYVSLDLDADKRERQVQLIGLSPCLTFVSGESEAPTPVCWSDLIKDYNSTRRCLCRLVKDRNEPNLGFKIDATLTLRLPYICLVRSPNISARPAPLHLAPISPDAEGRLVGLRRVIVKVSRWLVVSIFMINLV